MQIRLPLSRLAGINACAEQRQEDCALSQRQRELSGQNLMQIRNKFCNKVHPSPVNPMGLALGMTSGP